MKNRHTGLLVLITCIFSAFTLGFLLGRTSAPGDTIIARVPQETRQTVTVPETSAVPTVFSSPGETTIPLQTESQLININTATLAELDSLPGVGPVIAQRILDYREEHGPFTNLSQLTLVEGIGEKRLADIIDLITIE